MIFRVVLPAIAFGILLIGCSPTIPIDTNGQQIRPTELEAIAAATVGYRHQKGREPVDLQLEVLRLDAPLLTQKEYVACVSVEEKSTFTAYLGNGTVKSPIGSPIREKWAMLLRFSNGRWVPALFKQNLQANSLGILKPSDICGDA